MATLGSSPSDVNRFLESVSKNEYFTGEIIIVYQGTRLGYSEFCSVIRPKGLSTRVLHSSEKGLSKARNLGVLNAETGTQCFLFPDDDCYYPPDFFYLLGKELLLSNDESTLLLGSVYDPKTSRSAVRRVWPSSIKEKDSWKMACSITIFFKGQKNNMPKWNESLGLGAEFPSGEDSLFAWEVQNSGIKTLYVPHLVVFHPYKALNRSREYYYKFGLGQGRLDKLRRDVSHNMTFNIWTVSKWFISIGAKRGLRKSLKDGYLYGYFSK